jgi:hypothetical protein
MTSTRTREQLSHMFYSSADPYGFGQITYAFDPMPHGTVVVTDPRLLTMQTVNVTRRPLDVIAIGFLPATPAGMMRAERHRRS